MKQFLTLLTAAIGKSVDSPEVQRLFADQDITEELIVDDNDYETYVERPMLGYSLNIIEQEFIKNPLYNEPQNKTLVVRGCHFNSEGYEDYAQCRGELPFGINFEDSREVVLNKLGNSVWQYEIDGKVKRERWEFAETDKQFNVTYSNDQSSVKVVYFGIREFFTN